MGWNQAENAFMNVTVSILRACGQVCPALLYHNLMTADEALEQAKYNLRNHFPIVGITEDMRGFEHNIARRSYWLQDIANPKEEKEKRHSAPNELKEKLYRMLEEEEIQEALKHSESLRRERELFDVALEVMAYQTQELNQCSYEVPSNQIV